MTSSQNSVGKSSTGLRCWMPPPRSTALPASSQYVLTTVHHNVQSSRYFHSTLYDGLHIRPDGQVAHHNDGLPPLTVQATGLMDEIASGGVRSAPLY